METLLAFVIGGLIAISVYFLLRRNLIRVIFGVILLTTAVNLFLFTAGRLTRGQPPFIPEDQMIPTGVVANPLPQALILTSIVISFGLLAFTLALVYRIDKEFGTIYSNELNASTQSDQPTDSR